MRRTYHYARSLVEYQLFDFVQERCAERNMDWFQQFRLRFWVGGPARLRLIAADQSQDPCLGPCRVGRLPNRPRWGRGGLTRERPPIHASGRNSSCRARPASTASAQLSISSRTHSTSSRGNGTSARAARRLWRAHARRKRLTTRWVNDPITSERASDLPLARIRRLAA